MTLLRYVFREMRRRPGRTALTTLGIVIGVQALVAIPITIRTTRQAHRALFEGLTGKASLEVVPCGQGGFAPGLAAKLEAVQDVKVAVPVIQATAALRGRSGLLPIMTLGVPPASGDAARDYVLHSGSLLTGDGQVLLESNFAQSLGVDVGAAVDLLAPSGSARLRVSGLLEPVGAAAVNAGAVAIMSLSTSQRLHHLEGRVNTVNLVLADGADTDRVAREVAKQLPEGLNVQTPAARAASAEEALLNTERLLAILSVVSLVAGAFVILNSFLMNVSERRRTLAILRSLGATRKQVSRLLVFEAAVLGAIGTGIGVPLGLAASLALTGVMAQLAGTAIPQIQLSPAPILLGGMLGLGVPILAAYFPARSAGRRAPLAALRDQVGANSARDTHSRGALGKLSIGLFAFFALTYVVVLTVPLPSGLFILLLPVATVMVLVAAALVIPVILAPLSRLVERLLRPVLGIEASLAMRQLQRHPSRTALVVCVLMISVLLSIGFGNAILNSMRDVRGWNDRVFAEVDFLVTPTALSGTALIPVWMPEEYADQIAQLEGVERVGKGAMFMSRAAGNHVTIFARSCRPGEHPGFRFVDAPDEEVRQAVRRGEVAVGTALGQRMGLGRGDQIPIDTRAGTHRFTIAAMVSEYTSGGMLALCDWDQAKQFFELDGVQYIYVTVAPQEREAVDRRLRAFCDDHNLLVLSKSGFIDAVDKLMAGALSSFWVLLALVFAVASLGITNFLTMNVLEQTRELGILRAVAMKRRQVFKVILSQALAMGILGALPGVTLGILLSYAVTLANYPIVGLEIPYVLEPTLLIGGVAVALVVAVLASLLPARRASRLTIIRALQYE